MLHETLKNLYIGTSGIVLPGPKKTFPKNYQNTSRLHYYASLFNTLEVNSSFYKVPQPETFARWAQDVPQDFQFTIKIWRDITHARQLHVDQNKIVHFMKALSLMPDKKGCVLIQFPASITFDYLDGVKAILETINHLDPDHSWRKAVEFRHNGWYNTHTYAMLDQYRASLVLHDMPKSGIHIVSSKADFVYLRFHGMSGDYKGSYSDEHLRRYANDIQEWLSQGKSVYVYFNNTIGNAFANAQTLKSYI